MREKKKEINKGKDYFILNILDMIREHPELISLIFFEGVKTKEDFPTNIEQREQGYFAALTTTFIKELLKSLNGQKNTLSINEINKLYRSCTDNVQKLTRISKYFSNHRHGFNASFSQISDKKLYEDCYQELKNDPDRLESFFGPFTTMELKKFYVCPERLFKENQIRFENASYYITKFINTDAWINPDIYKEDSQLKDIRHRGSIQCAIEKILNDYYDDVKLLNETDQKEKILYHIYYIVKLVQRLERLHPYEDGNCRTFCMMLLNLELIKNGLYPVLQDDPNYFDILTKKELVIRIIEGQIRFKEYCQNKTLSPYRHIDGREIYPADEWFKDPLQHKIKLLVAAIFKKEQRENLISFNAFFKPIENIDNKKNSYLMQLSFFEEIGLSSDKRYELHFNETKGNYSIISNSMSLTEVDKELLERIKSFFKTKDILLNDLEKHVTIVQLGLDTSITIELPIAVSSIIKESYTHGQSKIDAKDQQEHNKYSCNFCILQ